MGLTWEILVQKNVPARMRDGTTLMSDVYRPAGEGEYPVLLTRLPYGKDLPRDATYFDPIKAAGAGYIVVVQDVRGRYASGGEFVPFVNEYEDGYDTVEWAARLPGSDGSVGMFGLSYFGKTQWQAAVMQPPSLKSMVPGVTWGNHLNGAQMRGGVQEVGLIHYWAQAAIAPDRLFRKYRKEPEKIGEKLPELVGVIDAILAGGGHDVLPLSGLPNPDGLVPFVRGGLERGVDDPSWDYLKMDDKYGRVDAPTFHIGGWYDCFIGETLRQYGAMKVRSSEAGMRPPRLLVGPWVHADFGSTFGDLDFGLGSMGAFVDYRGDLTDRHLRWLDATLKGDETALEAAPPVQIFVMGENRWRGYDEWPPPGSYTEDWHLRGGGELSREAGSSGEGPDTYDYDPKDPVPTLGGPTLLAPIHRPGARDQRDIERRPDVLTYTSEPLTEDYTVLGPVYATLFASSSAPDTDFVARLVDVYPDGRAIGLCDGIVRASARESYPAPGVINPTTPSPIEPGEVYEYCVDLWATGNTFKVGHRLRVEVTSSSHPRWERNLNTGESAVHSDRSEVARQAVFHDSGRPSRVTLTVVRG
ncbi:CocE/NonD family hydrolase [Rubrobacter tropicus]|uniref:CocE/NonD family hydrolase n=1 Tax=Rubrobacter tropicus TaxID=2653851 RepID=A0A6G8Q6F2_9ACTN|nr:CocE/NonD family hydrolase [Rubrobacter tropicus]QIN82036.1 CocE/NonD family hydrolase [Rubrobacter tropicus]